ncbi:AAA family ATPase [Enorma phocaeensis]|uniref:AAA family ATPase n=1 Tax=Enorma phocaeensis TaxID=1871019 RepID=UPI0023556326|nr:ATP-binding protein [Enorma phocaeensis]
MTVMLKRFSAWGTRNFSGWVTLDLSKTRDYQFNESCIRNGIIRNALIIGKNASGKTNLGRALADIREAFMGKLPVDDNLYLNADNGAGFSKFRYTFDVDGNEVDYSYTKTRHCEFLEEKLSVGDKVVFDYNHETGTFLESNLDIVDAGYLNLNYRDAYVSIASYITNSVPQTETNVLAKIREFSTSLYTADSIRRLSAEHRAAALSHIIEKGRVGDLERFLNAFGIEEPLEVLTNADGTKSVYLRCSNHSIPFADACSSGTALLLSYYIGFELDEPPSLIYIDEFDAFCHFEVADELLKFFSTKQQTQIICTTHNTSLVKNESMRPDCVFQIGQNREIRSLADSTDREIRRGHNMEKLLRAGEFN